MMQAPGGFAILTGHAFSRVEIAAEAIMIRGTPFVADYYAHMHDNPPERDRHDQAFPSYGMMYKLVESNTFS